MTDRWSARPLRWQLAIAIFLLLLVPLERSFSFYDAIRVAGTPWVVDLTTDPLYGWRALLMALNGAGFLLAGGLTAMLWVRWLHRQLPTGSALLGSAILWMVAVKSIVLAPYWINGVHRALLHLPRFDMDPKALIPAIWIPYWVAVPVLLSLALFVVLPVLQGATLWATVRSRDWRLFVAVQIPLLVAYLLTRLAPSVGPWLGD